MSIVWSEAELQRHLHPSGGYTKHSKIYQLLIDELQRMGNEARAKFLNFVTACPHLPPVGLSMLEIEVLPAHAGSAFPTAQTCGNKLYLPEYDSADDLRDGLAEALPTPRPAVSTSTRDERPRDGDKARPDSGSPPRDEHA